MAIAFQNAMSPVIAAHGGFIRYANNYEQQEPASLADAVFWGGAGSVVQVIYLQANTHGSKVQTAGNTMASTESAVGSGWG
jgi:uncharacterized membrane protein YjfL (UPF0719 family)